MSEITELTQEEWEQIKPKVVISSYGNSATFFNDIEDMQKASKIVTLNGSPIRQTTKKGSSMYERALPNIVKLPNGQYAVMSDTLRKVVGFEGKTNTQTLPEGL